jgi:hypothetical protein
LLVKPTPRNVNLGSGRFAMLNKERDISSSSVLTRMQGFNLAQAFCVNFEGLSRYIPENSVYGLLLFSNIPWRTKPLSFARLSVWHSR